MVCVYLNVINVNVKCPEYSADLVVVQRRVIAQSTDGSQLNQSVILSALCRHSIPCTSEKRLTKYFVNIRPRMHYGVHMVL